MAGQAPSRRELLQALTLAGMASAFSGFSRWNFALAEDSGPHEHRDLPAQITNGPYTPQFLSPSQYRTIEVLSELILPASEDSAGKPQPGAKDAGVAEFIDFMIFSDTAQQVPFREGLAWLDEASAPSANFISLPPQKQTALLERLAYKSKFRAGEKSGQDFFRLVRKYTVMGFYTTRAGLQSLDYPGLVFYGTSPGCTHEGNPEHVGL
jgi:gluconate 2-dehydrogenase gamma chain